MSTWWVSIEQLLGDTGSKKMSHSKWQKGGKHDMTSHQSFFFVWNGKTKILPWFFFTFFCSVLFFQRWRSISISSSVSLHHVVGSGTRKWTLFDSINIFESRVAQWFACMLLNLLPQDRSTLWRKNLVVTELIDGIASLKILNAPASDILVLQKHCCDLRISMTVDWCSLLWHVTID